MVRNRSQCLRRGAGRRVPPGVAPPKAWRRCAVLHTLALLCTVTLTTPLAAQHAGAEHANTGSWSVAAGAHGVPLLTTVRPILRGAAMTEAYLTQPTLLGTASFAGGALQAHATISLEALTLERGELGPGAYGEGYADRRHPHTYLHELVLTGRHQLRGVEGSLTAGRGFAPFGTDDPMMRPFVKFPVNHHLGQVLERLVAIGAVRAGPVLAEAGVFNGNEPYDASDLGSLERFGDSWAARLTILPLAGLEMQVSRAWVVSPELPTGGGWDQRKWSASGRYEARHAIGSIYALAEWNRTTQVDRGTDVFSFGSVLGEVALERNGWRPALRIERAHRPEEERLADPFRTPWPHGGGHVLGVTQWTNLTARVERSMLIGVVRAAPFVEGTRARVAEAEPGPFQPREFYGGDRIWMFSVGARLGAGWHPARMGRYGAATAVAPTHEH